MPCCVGVLRATLLYLPSCGSCRCSKRLAKMISTMRERMSAKLGNNNDNAFKMRKLFKMYDKQDTGMVRGGGGLMMMQGSTQALVLAAQLLS